MTTDRIRAVLATVNNVLPGFNSFTERTKLFLEIELSILRTGRPIVYRVSSQNDALFAAYIPVFQHAGRVHLTIVNRGLHFLR